MSIRKSLHSAAQASKTRLVCHAQSELVANHYEQETHPATPLRFEQQKPFLMWDYSPNQLNNYDDILPAKKKTSWRTLIGIDNIRNSGSAPLLFA